MEHDEAHRLQTPRTKAKIVENLGLLREYFRKRHSLTLNDEDERILFNALDWMADDVYAQCSEAKNV